MVTPEGLVTADLQIIDGKIAALLSPGTVPTSADVVDVEGCWIFPGAIDAHVHLGKDISAPQTRDDAALESASAVAGGVTTMLVYLLSPAPYEEIFPNAQRVMAEHSHANFGFHFCLVNQDQLQKVGDYAREFGVSSFKLFMNFRGDEGAYLKLPGNDDSFLFDALVAMKENDCLLTPHAENIELVWRLRKQLQQDGQDGLPAWNRSRPDYVEAEALGRVCYLARTTGASAYAVHVSSREAFQAIDRHRQEYPHLFIETCPHYLTLNEEAPLGSRGKVNPPLRTHADQEFLWEQVRADAVDVLGSDHVPRHYSAKDKDIWSASAGFPGVGTLFPLFLSEAMKRGVALATVARMTSTRPAELFGMGDRKGKIQVGYDADLTVVDPNQGFTVRAETQHSGAAYSVWEGVECAVTVRHTIIAGRFAVRDGVVITEQRGQYVPRLVSGEAALKRLATDATAKA